MLTIPPWRTNIFARLSCKTAHAHSLFLSIFFHIFHFFISQLPNRCNQILPCWNHSWTSLVYSYYPMAKSVVFMTCPGSGHTKFEQCPTQSVRFLHNSRPGFNVPQRTWSKAGWKLGPGRQGEGGREDGERERERVRE